MLPKLSKMKIIARFIKNNNFQLIDSIFCLGTENIIYNKGVLDFLKFLNANNIENYIISSNLKVFLENTLVSNLFIEIYATILNYNEKNEAIGIKELFSDSKKVEAIKNIIKKKNYKDNDCQNIIYIGDGLSDYYAMKYVKNNGGISICVHQKDKTEESMKLREKDVINFSTTADFSSNSELDNYIKKLCLIKNE